MIDLPFIINLMASIHKIPLEEILSFLSYSERMKLALTCKELYNISKPTLTSQYDHQISYLSIRSSLKVVKKPKKPQFISLGSQEYQMVQSPLYALPRQVVNLDYVTLEEKSGSLVLSNTFGDLLLLHPSWVSQISTEEDQSFEILADADDLNRNVDFHNPLKLLKRQRDLLEKLRSNQAAKVQSSQEQSMQYMRNFGIIVVILCHGGNFCISVFSPEGKNMTHQSDHRYVCRKKQGGRQLGKDKCSGKNIHSMGASIRRDNEKKHQEAIYRMIEEHSEFIHQASLVFLHAPGPNKYFFLGKEGLLERFRDKVRSVGMNVGKANYTETERVYKEITQTQLLLRLSL